MDSKPDSPDPEPSSQQRITENSYPLQYNSHGKLLLFGEHAAVHGHPALGISLDSTLTLSIRPADTNSFPGLSPGDYQAAVRLLSATGEIVPGLNLAPAEYSFEGSIPRSSGFGSSAAVCVTMARHVLNTCRSENISLDHLFPDFEISESWPDQEKSGYLLWSIANSLEKQFHGSPSGIDTGLAIRNGLTAFFPRSRKLPDVMPLGTPPFQAYLIYGGVSRRSNTRQLVGNVQKGMLGEIPRVLSAVEKLGDYAHEAITMFGGTGEGSSSPSELGLLASEAQEQLALLDLSTAELDAIFDRAIRLGSSGGKLSGAGGGGAFYLVCESEGQARDMREQLTVYCREKSIDLVGEIRILPL
jgi:mevalonate kinase